MTAAQAATPDRMQCMEVWGGNSAVDRTFEVPGLEVWIRSRTYEQAAGGGDVYYVSSCASGRVTRLLLADVSGHGRAASSFALDLRDLMRRNVNLIHQTRFVRQMNQQFSRYVDDDVFATALVCTFFSPTRSLQFSNAGHPAPMIYRAPLGRWQFAKDGAPVDFKGGLKDTPLGVFDGAGYSRYDTNMSPGDLVLCVSDAYIESCDKYGKILGQEGLLSLVNQLDVTKPAEIIPQLVEEMTAQQAENLCQDDATILLFRADGGSTSLADNLKAPLRLLGGVRDSPSVC